MCGGSAFFLVEASAFNRAHIGEEETTRRRTFANIDVAFIEFYGVFAVHDLLRGCDKSIDGIFQWVEPLAMINQPGPLRIKLALYLNFLFGQAELLEVAM